MLTNPNQKYFFKKSFVVQAKIMRTENFIIVIEKNLYTFLYFYNVNEYGNWNNMFKLWVTKHLNGNSAANNR